VCVCIYIYIYIYNKHCTDPSQPSWSCCEVTALIYATYRPLRITVCEAAVSECSSWLDRLL